MAIDSEAIWAALFERLEAATPSFVTRTRRYQLQWGIEDYPVLILDDGEGEETPNTDADAPGPLWTLTGQIGILCRPEESGDAPTTTLNVLIKEVREALERQPTDPVGGPAYYGGTPQHWTNLGGIGGLRVLEVTKVKKGPGQLAGQAVAEMSIAMEALDD